MAKTSIEWAQWSWNPIRGCTRVSEGCRHCYAERVAARFSGPGLPYEGLARKVGGEARWTGELRFVEDALLEPLRRRKPTTWFVNSMSDLFHEKVPDAWIDRIFAVLALAPQHTFQVLTKRPERMRAYLTEESVHERVSVAAATDIYARHPTNALNTHVRFRRDGGRDWPSGPWPLPNVWLGTSCEDQATADARVPELLATPAAVRFISAEPLLGPIDFRHIAVPCDAPQTSFFVDSLSGFHGARYSPMMIGSSPNPLPRTGSLDQIIVGGESGPGARPMHPDWARAIRDQCAAAGVPFFFKQWGAWAALRDPDDGEWPTDLDGFCRLTFSGDRHDGGWPMQRVGKKHAGRLLDGIEHNGMPPALPSRLRLAGGAA